MDGFGSDSLGESLLQWVNSFRRADKADNTWQDLSDGQTLWAILHEVDAGYFAGELPEPDVGVRGDWTRKWQNLKHVEKQVSMYYRDICNGQENINAGAVPDLKAIAADASVRDLQRLIMIMIRAAMASPESNQKMAARLMALGREKAMIVANELRSMEEAEYTESEPPSRDESASESEADLPPETPRANGGKKTSGLYRDPQLEREEEMLQAQATIEKLQASHAIAQQQLQELRLEKDRLQEAFDTYRTEIDTSKGRKGGAEGESLKKLQRQTDSDRAYIEDLENQLQSSRTSIEKYEKQVHQHKAEAEAAQKLRDDLQLAKAENEDLQQKIKANENLKKKIQNLQEQDKANSSLREQLKEANEKLDELEKMRQQQRKLEREILEKQGLIRNQEYQINETASLRRNAEINARKLMQELDAARERHERDFERISLLERQVGESSAADTTELEESDKTATSEAEARPVAAKSDDVAEHWAEKVSMLEKQLETSDARLKQANERLFAHAEVEDQVKQASIEQEKVQQQIGEQEDTIAALRKQLESSAKQSKEFQPNSDVTSLQRENQLMKTAWYELAGRLQNNGVSLGRRRQEPKSWIGKQRALVGPGGGIQR